MSHGDPLTPIVAATAELEALPPELRDRVAMIRRNASHLTKPVTFRELVDAIEAACAA